MIVVFCCCFVVLCLLVWFYVVMLLSKLEARKNRKRGGQKVEQLPVKSKGAVMFATLEIIVFLFFGFYVCRCVCLKTR